MNPLYLTLPTGMSPPLRFWTGIFSVPRRYLSFWIWAAVPTAMVFVAAGLLDIQIQSPTEQDMRRSFLENEAAFTQLVTLLEADAASVRTELAVIDLDAIARAGASPARVSLYGRLLAQINVMSLQYSPRCQTIVLHVRQSESARFERAYVYFGQAELGACRRESLGSFAHRSTSLHAGYARIKGNWFIMSVPLEFTNEAAPLVRQ